MKQVAALPWFVSPSGCIDVCLVTTRGSKRWIIPKGNMIKGLSPHASAAQEAFEEAGLVGIVESQRIGRFDFEKVRAGSGSSCEIDVYALRVERQLDAWPEMDERTVLRCDARTAMSLISIPGLVRLVETYFRSGNHARFLTTA